MNAPERFDLRAIAPQPWKNGAGLTREIAFGGASSTDFDWRISLAEVERDAPFSMFPGIERCIVLLGGAGMHLRSADNTVNHQLTTSLVPFRFAGDVALEATLADGPSTDFNVMARRGVFRSAVDCERNATTLRGSDRTLLLCHGGEWRVTSTETSVLRPMQALLWREPLETLRVEPSGDAAALLIVRLCHDRRP